MKTILATLLLAVASMAQDFGLVQAPQDTAGGDVVARVEFPAEVGRRFTLIYGFSGRGVLPQPVDLGDVLWHLPPCNIFFTFCIRKPRCRDWREVTLVSVPPGILPAGLTLYAQGILIDQYGSPYSTRVDAWTVQ